MAASRALKIEEEVQETQALAALGGVPTFEEAKLGPRFVAALDRYLVCKDDIEVLKEEKDTCSETISKAMAEQGLKKVSVKKNVVTLVDGTRKTLNRELLVENLLKQGLSAVIVDALLEASSTASNYTFIRVDQMKVKHERPRSR